MAAHRQNFLPWVLAALAFAALLLIAAMIFGFSSYRRALAGPTQSVVSQALSAPAKPSDPAAAPAHPPARWKARRLRASMPRLR